MNDTPDILQKILAHKREEVAKKSAKVPLREMRARTMAGPAPRNFLNALASRREQGKTSVIAEIKKASPSKGLLRKDFDPAAIAISYEAGGAACLSVLTDEEFFQGSNKALIDARNACNLPVLRKDFIIGEYQVHESRVLGADCILLIAAALEDEMLKDLTGLAMDLGMHVLVEVHDREELERAIMLRTPMIGINNRDLHTFKTDLQTTIGLMHDMPEDRIVVTESGIHAPADIHLMINHDVLCFLIGEAFMTAADPGKKLQRLFGY